MKPYFEKMTAFGRETPEKNKSEVENIRNILKVEREIALEVEKTKNVGLPDQNCRHYY